MKKCRYLPLPVWLLPLFLLLIPLAGCENPLSASPRPAFVDLAVILEKSRAAREAAAHLEKARAVLQKGMDDLTAAQKDAPEKERQQALSRGGALLQRQLAVEREAARRVVLAVFAQACEAWSRDNAEGWLVTRASVLAAPASADVTADILARMESLDATFPDLPTVSIRDDAPSAPDKADPSSTSTAPAAKNATRP